MFQEQTSKYKVLAAPNSMKGTVDAFRFATLIRHAFHRVSADFEVVEMPVADGGDFTAAVLGRAMGLQQQYAEVHDPFGRKRRAGYYYGEGTAVMEMTEASGMKLLKEEELNPLLASSAGTGEMIRDAVFRGAKKIILGVGGSATVDGGMGLLEGLGVVFYDKERKRLHASGEAVGLISEWDDAALSLMDGVGLQVICDVENPLSGEHGAVRVFAGQKGATDEMMPVLEKNLQRFAALILHKKGKDLAAIKGMGAAGGINLALLGFAGAEIVAGADYVLQTIGFDQALDQADLVVTGEGRIDGQTLANKAPYAVCKRAKQKGVPVYAIGGSVTPEGTSFFDRTYSLVNSEVSLDAALTHTEELILRRAEQAARDFMNSTGS